MSPLLLRLKMKMYSFCECGSVAPLYLYRTLQWVLNKTSSCLFLETSPHHTRMWTNDSVNKQVVNSWSANYVFVALALCPGGEHQPYRCRRPLGTANHNPITGPFQIGESESSANTGATYDDEISSFFPSFPLRKKKNNAMAFMTC